MNNYFLKISKEEDEACLITEIGSNHWHSAVLDFYQGGSTQLNKKGYDEYMKEGSYAQGQKAISNRQKFMHSVYEKEGLSENLRDLMNADALMRFQYHEVRDRIEERLASLRNYIKYPPNNRTDDDYQVIAAKKDLAIVEKLYKKHFSCHTKQ